MKPLILVLFCTSLVFGAVIKTNKNDSDAKLVKEFIDKILAFNKQVCCSFGILSICHRFFNLLLQISAVHKEFIKPGFVRQWGSICEEEEQEQEGQEDTQTTPVSPNDNFNQINDSNAGEGDISGTVPQESGPNPEQIGGSNQDEASSSGTDSQDSVITSDQNENSNSLSDSQKPSTIKPEVEESPNVDGSSGAGSSESNNISSPEEGSGSVNSPTTEQSPNNKKANSRRILAIFKKLEETNQKIQKALEKKQKKNIESLVTASKEWDKDIRSMIKMFKEINNKGWMDMINEGIGSISSELKPILCNLISELEDLLGQLGVLPNGTFKLFKLNKTSLF